MKHGRTAIVNFLSRFSMSIAGFVATLTLTNILGKETYGTYVVVISVLSWAALSANLGVSLAVRKRVSESVEGDYVSAGAALQFGLYALVALGIWVGREPLNAYMGVQATGILLTLLAVQLARGFIKSVLEGQHLVHVSSVLSPVEAIARSAVQVVLVLLGFELFGAFFGYFIGGIVATSAGAYFARLHLSLPSREDISHLTSYAKFSWLSGLKGKAFLSMDTLVLAFFVTNSVIAVYNVAWNVASLFAIFGTSVAKTLFPEISEVSSIDKESERVTELLRTSLGYAGLFLIPGLVGGAIVGDVVLTIYGRGFDTGYYILLILTFARLIYAYQSQFLSTIDAIDRPEITFQVSMVFVVTNVLLNFLLVWQYGWYGAAAATTITATISLALAYRYARNLITVQVPLLLISKQLLSAGVMAAAVLVGRELIGDSLPIVVGLVGIGSAIYFGTLLTISDEFRTTVEDNIPWQIPHLGLS
jgi:O-antigen/teichoic acid export membrane protein